ncbi:MAG: hypothetical protein K2X98_02445, partial [Alphaproteobacteria bacterium]|nr:hypothetical protein [Alphaproteobacteria bacterium]
YTHTQKTIEGQPDLREVVAKPEAIDTLKGMLEQVILKGTGRRHLSPIAQKHDIRIFGKTGTTNDCKDAWFVGFVGNLVIGVFVGFPVPRPLGDDETGGKAAAPIAADFLDQYFTGKLWDGVKNPSKDRDLFIESIPFSQS